MEEAEAAEVGVLPAAEAPLGLHPAHIPTVPVLCSFPLQRSCNLAAALSNHQCCFSTCNQPAISPLNSLRVFLQVL